MSRKPYTLDSRIDLLFYILMKRQEYLERRMDEMTKATEDLTREVQETRDAVLAKVAEMQKHIDDLLANPADESAVIAAAEALNELQGELAAKVEAPAEPAASTDPNA